MRKYSYQIKMTYDVSDADKVRAKQALAAFEKLSEVVESFTLHLDLLATPFRDGQTTPEQIMQFRATLRNFRDKAIENMNNVKKTAITCVQIMNNFMSSTQVEKIMSSFNDALGDMIKQFDAFVLIFGNIDAETFKDTAIKAIDSIKKEAAQLKQLIKERIHTFINNEILAKTWIDGTDVQNGGIQEKVPFDKELINQQEQALNKSQP